MHSPLAIRLRLLVIAVLLVCASHTVCAQGPVPEGGTSVGGQGAAETPAEAPAEAPAETPEDALTRRIEKAIASYEAVRDDPKKSSQRRRFLAWVGEIDDPRVSDYLAKDLKRYAAKVAGEYSVSAIAKLPRPDLTPALLSAVKRGKTHSRVRVAATRLLTTFANDTCDELLDLAADLKPGKVRSGLLTGLSTCDSVRVSRGLAKLLLDGDHAHRLQMLLATQEARGDSKIDNARIRCVREGNLIVAATAWRLLVEQGHRRGEGLTLDVFERIFDKPSASAAVELVQGLVIVGDEDFFPAILRFGAIRGAAVKRAVRKVAARASKNPAMIAFLIEEGLESESPAERSVAKVLLSKAPAEAVAPLVARVRKELKRNRRKVLDSAAGLHDLLAKDPTWVKDLAALAAAPDLESRLLGIAMLLEMESRSAITNAQRYLSHRSWELRSLSYRYLTKCRDVTSIPFLIKRFGREEGRLAHELATALFKHTGTRCWSERDWSSWWRANNVGFALPHPLSVKGGGSTSGGKTISYYDIPLVSSRIAFLVDHSGSMGAVVGTDKKRNRLVAAQEQLRLVLSALPKTHRVNLIPFETDVTQAWRELKSLSNANRKELLELVAKIKLAGGTNTFGALMHAMEDPEVDTIYLLTDGVPSSGELVDPEEILEAVMRENRIRQVVIHCISIGMKSTLLKDLADLTGGEYKEVL